MAKFGGDKTVLDPRKPFSVEEGGVITDLRSNFRLSLVYNSSTGQVIDQITNTSMMMMAAGTNPAYASELYGSPTSWKLTNTAKISTHGNISHARNNSTVSFWFKNDAGAPASLNAAQQVFLVTGYTPTYIPPTPTKFSVFSVSNVGGEELTFGWTDPSGNTEWYLSTRNTEVMANRQIGNPNNAPFGGDAPNADSAFVKEMQRNPLEYGKWHHVVICTSRGNANDTTGKQSLTATNLGKTAVYVNGKLTCKYLGYSEPGKVTKPYGSSPVEKYGFQQYTRLESSISDFLWFQYNSMIGNRQFYQFCAWDRILSDREVQDLYLGTLHGVHIESVTGVSAPPRKHRNSSTKIVKNVNVGFGDSKGTIQQLPFDDRRSIAGVVGSYRGSNYPSAISNTPFAQSTEKFVSVEDISVLPYQVVRREIESLSDNFTQSPYSENLGKNEMELLDGTHAKAIVRIGISSQLSMKNVQFAGRTDSKFARTVTGIVPGKCSLFMSSVLKDDPLFSRLIMPNNAPTGIAGTGFLYYSPVFKAWIEKRYQGEWLTAGDTEKNSHEYYDAVNSVTYDTAAPPVTPLATHFVGFTSNKPNFDSKFPWIIASNSYATSSDRISPGWFWSGSMSSAAIITGTNETLAQFTASPQLGYFLPFKEHLERAGYPTIGSPTVVFGAPFSPRYHGYDYETIKLKNYIDRPFRLKKVILRLPVTVTRKNEIHETPYGGAGGAEWTKNVPSRRDLDNYVFFLYRQRRQTNTVIDSQSDISSSVRFLVASGSLCVYNSPSFGRAYSDGFADSFGDGTTVEYQNFAGNSVSANLGTLYRDTKNSMTDQLTLSKLTACNSPLHGPSYSIDAGLDDFSDGVHTFFRQGRVQIDMYPAVVMGGVMNSTLTYVTSTTGHYSSSLFFSEGRPNPSGSLTTSYNQLYNRYPYTGSYIYPNDPTRYGPISTSVQNIWLGGTRQPEFVNDAANGTSSLTNVTASLNYRPYYTYSSGSTNDTTLSKYFTGYYGKNHTDPLFDIEVARCGLSLSNHGTSPFSSPFQIVTDSRTVHGAYSIDNRKDLPAVFQRTNLISYQMKPQDENLSIYSSILSTNQSSIGTLSGSDMSDLISSLTTGNQVSSPNTNRQILRDYILLPTDEIILGLDAGITPPPDIAPLSGEPYPDKLNP